MARQIGKLSAVALPKLKKPGLYGDGGGLYLRVTGTGGKFWAFRYMMHKKAREMGLGALHALTLAEARDKAGACRKLLADGTDPITYRNQEMDKRTLAAARARTFKQCATEYLDDNKGAWRNSKHRQQWENSLKDYVYPIIGDLPAQDVGDDEILRILKQKRDDFPDGKYFWQARPETASRVRGRVEVILDWAKTRKFRDGENPARWRGHLENLLPARKKIQKVRHHPALPYQRLGEFIAVLREQEGQAARALEFTILTVARTNETIGGQWIEIDLSQKIWTVPENRIKGEREHRVPLPDRAVEILVNQKKLQKETREVGEHLFNGLRKGQPLSNMAMLALLDRMGYSDITVHGFRSTFRDWAAEQTNFAGAIAEAALAHVSGDKVEAAYLRSDLFNKRRQMMDAWSRYCATRPNAASREKVVQIGGRKC